MDLILPIVDGYQATEKIRAFEKEKQIQRRTYICANSAQIASGDKLYKRQGFDRILMKPVQAAVMKEIIEKRHATNS